MTERRLYEAASNGKTVKKEKDFDER